MARFAVSPPAAVEPADVNEPLSGGKTLPIEVATVMGNAEAVRLLIEKGAGCGRALHMAVSAGQLSIAKLLLEHKPFAAQVRTQVVRGVLRYRSW